MLELDDVEAPTAVSGTSELPSDAEVPTLAEQLPSTILQRIFELLQEESEREGSLRWLSVCHVCRQWRAGALGNQLLWATLNPSILSRCPRLLDIFLQYSGDVPLRLLVDVAPNCNDRALRHAYRTVLSTQLHRVQALVYAHTDAQWQIVPTAEELVPLLKGPAPQLQTLRLTGFKRSKFLFREAGTLLNFLTDHAPNIQELDIGQFPPRCFPWGSPPIAIRTLILSSDTTVDGVSNLTYTQMLDSLRAMPALQILSLSGIVPKVAPGNLIEDRVHLPRLQKLRLTGSGEQYTSLWYNLKTHPECAIQLEIIRTRDFPPILIDILARHYAECDVSSLDELFVKQNTTSGFSYALYPLGIPPDENGPASQPYTHPSVNVFVAWDSKLDSVSYIPGFKIFAITPLQQLKRITSAAVDSERIEPEKSAALGTYVYNVEHLILLAYRPSQLSSFFLILGGSLLPESSDGEETVPLPLLQELTLKQCDFDRDIAESTLRDTLERRKRGGVTLDMLTFVDCGLQSGRVEELEVAFVQTGLVRRIVCGEGVMEQYTYSCDRATPQSS